jgi:hypothetical protein
MWLRVAAVSDVAHISGPDQALRRMHPQSMMQTSYSDDLVDIAHRRSAYESFFANLPSDHAAHAHAATARRRLAEEALEDLAGLLLRGPSPSCDVDRYIGLAKELGEGRVPVGWQLREVEAWLRWRQGQRRSSWAAASTWAARRRVEHRMRRYRWYWMGV